MLMVGWGPHTKIDLVPDSVALICKSSVNPLKLKTISNYFCSTYIFLLLQK